MSIFVTAIFKGGTNSLPPEIHVGRVAAGVGDASIKMLLPFCRSGRQLFRSGGAAVLGVDAIGGPPHGDFTNQSGAQRTALRHPMGLSAVVVGVMSNVVGEVGDQLGPPGQVVPPVGVIVDRLGNSRQPGQRWLAVGGSGFWEAPVQDGGNVFSRAEITPECGFHRGGRAGLRRSLRPRR